jgi:hypothetical protein
MVSFLSFGIKRMIKSPPTQLSRIEDRYGKSAYAMFI